ncbi:Retrovirus-related Pol polyprotein from transposon gypsy [Stylophora pistillata]|uniref:Retrovirus-related Pol polyprotein from transposon gypsy n=1 Tax=Stylophora pistillata TaxID=50429 RepID=A0A2B4RTN0_STYPI|nr:Retrovirus-related Pol polyprotein from transposon gypsy [Stylophora pistillata]
MWKNDKLARQFSKEDQEFIHQETIRLLAEAIIEPSTSPWRAQVVISKDPLQRHKKRLCIDYSQTANAYPLPRIDDMVNNLASHKVFSTFDLNRGYYMAAWGYEFYLRVLKYLSAYHQVPIKDADRKYTGFEANGRLYQFCRIPFGVTNGVAVFQRAMDKFVEEESLKETFPYLDNITVAEHDLREHDDNVKKFREAVQRRQLTLNESKTVESKTSLNLLGYCIGNGLIAPDQERLRPLKEFPPPENSQSLKRIVGMLAYYAKWVPNFFEKIRPLSQTTTFPLDENALSAFTTLKKELERASLHSVDESLPFIVETDASETALSATLNQAGRPVPLIPGHSKEVNYTILLWRKKTWLL